MEKLEITLNWIQIQLGGSGVVCRRASAIQRQVLTDFEGDIDRTYDIVASPEVLRNINVSVHTQAVYQ